MYIAEDPTRRGNIAVILIWLWLAVQCADSVSSLFTIEVLGGFGGGIAPPDRLQLADSLATVTTMATLVMLIAAAVGVLRWISLTNRNAQTWSNQIEITPGWAIGWFFVPVANLFKPFQGVSATWRATVAPDADINSVDVPIILRWWWGLWLARSIWSNISLQLFRHATTPEQVITGHWLDLAKLTVAVPLTIVLTRIIRRLSAMQSQLLARSDRAIAADDDPI